jgi:ATP-dependent Clp protease ATP-binding subunit ClpC
VRLERFTMRACVVVRLAQEEAQRLQGPASRTEHLLLGRIREREAIAARVLQRLGADDPDCELRALQSTTGRGAEAYAGDRPWTARAAADFAQAAGEARDLGTCHIGTEHLLRERDSVGARVMVILGVDLDEACWVTPVQRHGQLVIRRRVIPSCK